jgi:hypothetical protein
MNITNIKEWPEFSKDKNVLKTKIRSFALLNDLMTNKLLENKNNYVFRGHRKSNWVLKPSLYRDPISIDKESKHIANFRKNILGRRGANPQTLDDVALYSLGQHFKLKTPLLDWTTSIYVALFFAFAEKKADDTTTRIIYGINRHRIELQPTETILDKGPIVFYDSLCDENMRLISQSGLFTLFNENIEIEEWIKSSDLAESGKIILAKIYLDNSMRDFFLKQLNWMNINYLTLFPDLEGSARHTNLQNEIDGY